MRSVVTLAILTFSVAALVGCASLNKLAGTAGIDAKDLQAAGAVAGEVADATPKNIYETAAYNRMVTLGAALSPAGLDKTLEGAGPFTVFAPTEEAFKKIPAETLAVLMSDSGREKLKAILAYHVVSGVQTGESVAKATTMKSVGGPDITIARSADGKLTVGGASIVKADVTATNGVIHVIDTVMMPPDA